MIKGIIFDCFGVIIADIFQVMRAELRARDPAAGARADDLMHANHRGMLSSQECNQQMAELFNMSLQQFLDTVNKGETKDAELIGYIKQQRRSYKTALLSNIGAESLHKRFSDDELAELFDAVVVSGDVGYAKPEPQIYEIAADRLGLRYDECLFTDDKPEFCEAARAVGMQAIVYQSFGQFTSDAEAILGRNDG
jgi:HAD superfamily hydrolase (TIGR01509 family)